MPGRSERHRKVACLMMRIRAYVRVKYSVIFFKNKEIYQELNDDAH